MKTLSFLIAGTTILLSVQPAPTGLAQQAAVNAAVQIPSYTPSTKTDSLEQVVVEKSIRGIEKSRRLVDISKEVRSQSQAIAKVKRQRMITQRVVIEKDTCIVVNAKPIVRKNLLWRIFHRSR